MNYVTKTCAHRYTQTGRHTYTCTQKHITDMEKNKRKQKQQNHTYKAYGELITTFRNCVLADHKEPRPL